MQTKNNLICAIYGEIADLSTRIWKKLLSNAGNAIKNILKFSVVWLKFRAETARLNKVSMTQFYEY